MSSFEAEIRQAKELLFQGRLGAATDTLNRIQASTKANLRELAHVRGVLLMRNGAYQEAIDLFLNSSSRYGHHVLLLIDLAACYFLTGQKQDWLRILDLAEFEFKRAESEISPRTWTTFHLTLGKMREEQGALAEAMDMYEKLLEFIRAQKIDRVETEKHLKVLSQILRIKSQSGLSAQASRQYKDLIHHSASETNWETAFEIEHALMIFECRQFGADFGWARLEKILKNPLAQTQEASLILCDFIYELMMQEHPVPREICERLSEVGNLSPYEQAILDLARDRSPETKDMFEWQESMSNADHLRLLSLCIKRKLDKDSEKRFLLLIRDFSDKTRKLWLALTETEKLLMCASFAYDPVKKCLTLADLSLSLKEKPAHQELIELLMENGPLAPEKAVRLLWNGEGFNSDISRLRMRVRRLNAEIKKAFGRGDFMTLTGKEIGFTSTVRTGS